MDTDVTLLERWRRERDAEAFQELVARHAGMVYATCRRILRNAADAEDLTQECFLQLAQRPWRPQRSIGGWLHALATHRALDRIKAESRRRARESKFQSAHQPHHQGSATVADQVDEALATIDKSLRELLVLHFFEGCSHDEIARATEVSRATITRRIAEGVEQVRRRLRAKGIAVPTAALSATMAELKAEAAPGAVATALGKVALAGGGELTAAAGATFFLKAAAISVAISLAVGGAVVAWRVPAEPSLPVHAAVSVPIEPEPAADPASSQSSATAVEAAPERDQAEDETRADEIQPPGPVLGALVEGVALDLQGRPVPGARVDCYGAGSDFAGSTQVFSNEAGRFRFSEVPPTESFRVHASTDEPRRQSVETVLDKLAAGDRYDLQLMLHEARVSGRVVDAAGRPVRDAEVMAQPVDWISYGIPTGRSDAAGRFTIAGLAEGEYVLKTNWAGGQTPWPNGGVHVTLRQDEVRGGFTLTLAPEDGFTIGGRVTTPDGDGIPDVHLSAHLPNPPYTSQWARTDADGYFLVEGLAAGTHMLQASHPEYGDRYERDVEAGTESVNLVMEPRGSVNVQVVDAQTQLPVRPFEVFERTRLSDVHHNMVTESFRSVDDDQGRVTLAQVGPGATPVRVRAEGYAEWTGQVDVPPGEVAVLLVELVHARTIRGKVQDEAGAPVVGAIVFAGKLPQNIYEGTVDGARTDERGHFERSNVHPQEEVVSCDHPSYAPGYAALSSGNDLVSIVLDAGVRVTGIVTIDGAPLTRARVSMFYPGWTTSGQSVPVDDDGAFELLSTPRSTGILCVAVKAGDGTADYDITRDVDLTGAPQAMSFDLEVVAGTSTVQGTVFENGSTRGGLYMVLHMEERDGWTQVFSTHANIADGAYRFDNVPAGPGVVRVYPAGAPQEVDPVEVPVIVRAGEMVTCDVEMPSQ